MGENKERIFFGSLEIQEKERLDKGPSSTSSTPSSQSSSSSSLSSAQVLPFSNVAVESQEKHIRLLQQLEEKKRARTLAVPTNDADVKTRLRDLGEPIILFGEKPEDRRVRLREVMAKLNIQEIPTTAEKRTTKKDRDKEEEAEPYLTEGTPELKAARMWIAGYSVRNARERIVGSKRKRGDPEAVQREADHAASMTESFKKWTNTSSQIGDDRPLCSISFSPDSSLLATAAWTGTCKLWDVGTCSVRSVLKGHAERVHHVVFHPQATLNQTSASLNIASGSADRTVKLWSLEPGSAPLASLTGHADRINRIAFHPSGRFLASSSNDKTWRLWDLETRKCLLEQEGHSREVYGIAFQCDGSLVAAGGKDSIIRLWDTRSGKSIHVFQGHVKQVLALDFAPNGYQLASGSEDHSARIWDLRKKRNVQIIPAHSSLISCLKFQSNGDFLITGAFDKTIKIWATKDWSPVKIFAGHEDKIMGMDISANSKYIASAAYDRTWKLWTDESMHS